jgi:sodium transport system permease protein
MPLKSIGVVYRKELTEALRDRRTLISTIVVPLLLFPVMSVGFASVATLLLGKAKDEIAKVMVLGGSDSPAVMAQLKTFEKPEDRIEIVPPAANWKEQVVNKDVRAVLEIPDAFQEAVAAQKDRTVTIYTYGGELKSSLAAGKIEKHLNGYRDAVVKDRLSAKNLPQTVLKPFAVKQENVAPPEKVGGAAIGGLIGYMIVLLCMTGAMYPAMDLTAGEKERGTMETILSSPISRRELVLGKFSLVLSASLATAALSVISMGVSFWVAQRFHAFDFGEDHHTELTIHASAAFSVFLMALPIAVLFSAVLFTIALFAKTYKEAQSYLTPMTFIVIIPAIAALLPGVDLTAKLALIPILNVSLLCKELIAGTYHWGFIGIIFASTCVYAGAALFIAIKMFQRESVLFRS